MSEVERVRVGRAGGYSNGMDPSRVQAAPEWSTKGAPSQVLARTTSISCGNRRSVFRNLLKYARGNSSLLGCLVAALPIGPSELSRIRNWHLRGLRLPPKL